MNLKRNQEQWIKALTKFSWVMVVADLLMWVLGGLIITALANSFLFGGGGFLVAPFGAMTAALIRLYVMRRNGSLDFVNRSQTDPLSAQPPKSSQQQQRQAEGWHLGWDVLATSVLFAALVGGFGAATLAWPIWQGVLVGAGIGWLLGILALGRDGRFSFKEFTPKDKTPTPTTQAVTIAVLNEETEIGQQILIEKPLSEVFGYVNDFVRHSEWRTGVVQIAMSRF